MTAKMLPEGKLYDDKYNIYDPESVNFVERTDFLKSLSGTHTVDDELEDVVQQTAKSYDLRLLAGYYTELKRREARLPKFSRWVTGMFANNAQFAEELARAGQSVKKTVTISTSLLDILRSGDTHHFSSCYGIRNNMPTNYKIPVTLAEEAPGVALAYIDDDKGFMVGRQWIVHGADKDGDIAVLSPMPVGNFQQAPLVKALKQQGHRVAVATFGYDNQGHVVSYVGGIPTAINFDVQTWKKDPRIIML